MTKGVRTLCGTGNNFVGSFGDITLHPRVHQPRWHRMVVRGTAAEWCQLFHALIFIATLSLKFSSNVFVWMKESNAAKILYKYYTYTIHILEEGVQHHSHWPVARDVTRGAVRVGLIGVLFAGSLQRDQDRQRCGGLKVQPGRWVDCRELTRTISRWVTARDHICHGNI